MRTDQFIDQATDRVGRAPGVVQVGAAGMVPLMKRTAMAAFELPAALTGGKPTHGRARVYTVTAGYGEAVGLRVAEGRFLDATDRRGGRLAAVVNQEFVRRHLAVPRVAGLTVPGLVEGASPVPAEIVGVVADVLKNGHDDRPEPEIYVLHGVGGHRIAGRVNLVIRTAGDPAALAPAIRTLVRDVDPEIVVDRIEPLARQVEASLDAPRFAASVMSAFAGVATLLAGIGLFGALSYGVSQRGRELSVRAALGAQRGDLVRLVVGEGLLLLMPGIALGLLGALAFARMMRTLLFGVGPLDAVAFTAAPALLLSAAVLASLLPALRAAGADPAVTLRR